MKPFKVPSPSRLDRVELCPGSWARELALPKEPSSKDAERGIRIHEALAEGRPEDLPKEDERLLAIEALRLEAQVVDQFFPGKVPLSQSEVWLTLSTAHGPMSGKADRILSDERLIVVVDWKTGRSAIDVPEENLQLLALVSMFDPVRVAGRAMVIGLIQPDAHPPVQFVHVSEEMLERAHERVRATVEAAMGPDPKINPHPDACRYCPAATLCPELRQSLVPDIVGVESLPSDQLSNLLDRAQVMAKAIEVVREEAKRRIELHLEVPGWTLHAGRTRVVVTDPAGLYAKAKAVGVTPEAFLGAVEVGKKKLEEAVRAATGERGKGLEQVLRGIYDGVSESVQDSAYLQRVKA